MFEAWATRLMWEREVDRETVAKVGYPGILISDLGHCRKCYYLPR